MNLMIVVLLSWLAAGAAAGLLLGRAGRDRHPDRPEVAPPPEPQPDPAAVVAIHGLLQSAGFVESGIADLRSSWDLQPRAARNELLERLHAQSTLMREQLASLLAEHPALAEVLDGLDRKRSVGSG